MLRPRLRRAGTIFVYGQTGAGKTFTIDDLSTTAIREMFAHLRSVPDAQYALYVSVVELYNESLRDLVSGARPAGQPAGLAAVAGVACAAVLALA
jgi:hypothetical protein